MIINGGSRSNWRFFSKHLVRADENERVNIMEIRGLAAETVYDAFNELSALASGTRTKNFFYHANINPREGEVLTPEQWERAIDELESKLGLEGQSRFVVEHEKEGRAHCHVIWSRIDPDTLTAISDSNNFMKHEQAARALEAAFGHEAVQGVHGRDEDIERPDRRPKNWEKFRGHSSGIDPEAVKAELTELWRQADSGQAFAAALEERGYLLAKGDKRDFCVIDQAGDSHSLARRIDGTKAKDIRARMADIDRDALPSVAEASELMKARPENAPANTGTPEIPPTSTDEIHAAEPATPFDKFQQDAKAVMEGNGGDLRPLPQPDGTKGAARPDHAATEPLSLFQRFVNAVKDLMHSAGGHLPLSDGLSWWERAAMVAAPFIEHAAERVAEKVTGYWQNFVDRHASGRNSEPDLDHDHGIDR
jgi:hypothetical protein